MSTAASSTPEHPPIGVVLVGGSSRRMGADKATLVVDGAPMGTRAVQALEDLGLEVLLLGADVAQSKALRRPCWPDEIPGNGPMAALAGVLACGFDAFALPCDLPNIRAEALAPLLSGERPRLARIASRADRPAFPIGWWRSHAALLLRSALDSGDRSFAGALKPAMAEIEFVELSNALDDADVPEDLHRLGYPRPMIDEIDIAEFATRRAAGQHVLDVREPHEYEEAHVPGAQLIPLGEVAHRAAEVPDDGPILMICRSGARSMQAATILSGLGREVTNVAGGTLAWIEAGFEVAVGMERG